MLHERISAWNKMIAKYRWHYIPVCSLVGHDQLPRLGKRELICLLLFTCNYVVFVWRSFLFLWVLRMDYVILLWHSLSLPYNYYGWKLADDNAIDYQKTSGCIFLQHLIDIMYPSDTGLESESQNYDDTEQANENDNTTDVVYGNEADDEANFLSKWSYT